MKNKIFVIGFGGLLITSIILNVVILGNQKRTAYFDYNKVYNDCTLKTKLEKDLEKVVSLRKSELDSMQLELTFMSNKVNSGNASQEELNVFEDQKNRYLTFQNRYEEENIRLKEEYFNQIRKHINDKSKAYAEEEGLDYLFAAVGDGSLMYAGESEDVTNEFMSFLDL